MILALILSIALVNSQSDRNLRRLDENTSFDLQQNQVSGNLKEVDQVNSPKGEITRYKMTIIEMYTMDVTKLPQFQNISTQQDFIDEDEDEFLIRADSITQTLNQSQ